ncbi:transcription elongation factor NusA [Methanofervidicoccus sp. A16]|uniref:NusA-like transcription termination signal-binding factor n=1 Tax=Methanofervidicoccus sp. A16 TaxID=2607662 RepID=UPI00118B850D|nr:NusA-like transcription termination signal-binding factor [Methanofervidicoccus sp. A16]AXI24873.1 transcription elongation factor NusA [Methanofervidicoccus sp. A16]MBW9220516.1 NusA-like transcription termination signal-binding factor [Methanothermococcus sp. SCGC AD-155-N22]HIQ39450.1 NusA-like transcription termination signal-binding factor [Methanothermococcus okinawensis]
MKVRLTTDDIMKINYFEKLTGAEVIDCVSDDERIVFVVKEGNMGAAIGRGGENVKTAMEKFNKKVDIVEYSKDLKKFVRNIFEPLKLEDVWIKKQNGKLVVYIRVDPKLKRAIIGERGKNINRAITIMSRLSDAKNIRVISGFRRPKVGYRKFRRGRFTKNVMKKPRVKEETPDKTKKEENQ